MLSERQLHEEIEREGVERRGQRREGSDVDWGGGSDDQDGGEESREGEGMEVDEEIDVRGMKAFVRSMGVNGQRHMGEGDLDDEERMRVEDESESEGENENEITAEIAMFGNAIFSVK